MSADSSILPSKALKATQYVVVSQDTTKTQLKSQDPSQDTSPAHIQICTHTHTFKH